jgi:DNA-binding transcriptional MerR regulator
LILRAKEAFTLDEIKELFQIYDEHPDAAGEQQQFKRLCEMMERKVAQIDNQMAELAKLRGDVQVALEDIRSKIWTDGTEPTNK